MSNSVNCSSCGAANQMPDGKNSMFCAFCGTSIQNNVSINNSFSLNNLSKAKIKHGYLAYKEREIKSLNEIINLYSDSELEKIEELDLSNNLISSLNGIERFTLKKVNLSNNNLKIIDKLPQIYSEYSYGKFYYELYIILSNNKFFEGFSDDVIDTINEKIGFGNFRFELNLLNCPKFDLNQLKKINFSQFLVGKPSNYYIGIIEIDETINLPQELLSLGFTKGPFGWEIGQKEVIQSTSSDYSFGYYFMKEMGCFIATATMGSYDHPEVMELRYFRDNWILKKSWGEGFVKWYYHYGAIAAKVIEKSFVLKKISYLLIVKPLVYLSRIVK